MLPDSCLLRIKTIHALCGGWGDPPVQCLVFWPFFSTPGPHEDVQPRVQIVTPERHSSPPLFGRLANYHRVVAPLQHCQMLLQLCQDLRIVVNWEKSDLEPTQGAQYLEMLLDTI